jgi:hypothetical protein
MADDTPSGHQPAGDPPHGPEPSRNAWATSGAILPSQPPKEPIAALLFNVFFASVGYFIIGQWQKGIAASIAFILELAMAFGIGLVAQGCGVCIVIPLSMAFHAVLSADCYLQAKALQLGKPIGQWTFFNQHL